MILLQIMLIFIFIFKSLESNKTRKILFSNIPGAGRNREVIQSGYESLNWENFCYVEESYAHKSMVSAWETVFKYSRYVIYNKSGSQQMYIRSNKPLRTFSIESIDATVVDRDNSEWTFTGLRSNIKLYTKAVTFEKATQYKLISLNFADIDEITIITSKGYPDLVIGCINLID